ncbi:MULTISPECIES: hypothetical protein [Pseudomonas chlororaphis group]|uniref:MrpH family fimbial adhesin n=1 Tax=Pseudomonas chlororaphis group TaxID=136842 RepID=UPI002096EB39|nr:MULTISPECIES: hypothetical protein [Pseudomonas chlororaphis group]MCO7580390.1 hypothetical protein [Pseudomonas protegens]MCO7586493.1 hypothetical protein [Pseudomonas chlororaphis]MCO7603526.1 hypothetical protein [Pseudomonas chlororaphis]
MKKNNTTVLRSALAAVLMAGVAAEAHAISITTAKTEYVPGGVRYHFVVNSWNNLAPSPCASNDPAYSECRVQFVIRKTTNFYNPVGTYSNWTVPIRGGSNLGDLLNDLQSKGFQIPFSGSFFVASKDVSPDLCVGFGFVKLGPDLGGTWSPFGPCSRVTEPMLQCNISGSNTIDHKRLVEFELNGNTASTRVTINCSGASSVTLFTSNSNSYGVQLRPDGSLYTKITVNGEDATKGINIAVKEYLSTPVTITSTLVRRSSVSPGEFSGYTILTVSPP